MLSYCLWSWWRTSQVILRRNYWYCACMFSNDFVTTFGNLWRAHRIRRSLIYQLSTRTITMAMPTASLAHFPLTTGRWWKVVERMTFWIISVKCTAVGEVSNRRRHSFPEVAGLLRFSFHLWCLLSYYTSYRHSYLLLGENIFNALCGRCSGIAWNKEVQLLSSGVRYLFFFVPNRGLLGLLYQMCLPRVLRGYIFSVSCI